MFQLSKKRIIIIVIIWVVLLGFIGGGTYYFNYKNNELSYKEKNNGSKDYNDMDYYSFYDENDLDIKKEYLKDNEFGYIKISGLKNKGIENKLNEEFKKHMQSEKNSGANNCFSYVGINAFNILSVSVNCGYDNSNKTTYKYYNIDLNTGDAITFDDLFTESANISSILYNGYYNRISTDISGELLRLDKEKSATEFFNKSGNPSQYYGGRTLDEINKDINKYESELDNVEEVALKKSREYENSMDKQFLITNNSIELPYKNYITVSLMARYNIRYFNFYKKYKTNNSIFDSENVGNKNLFLSSINNGNITYSNIRKVSDYGFVDYELFDESYPKFVIDYTNNIINKNISNFDKNNFTYLNINANYVSPNKGDYNTSLGYIDLYLSSCNMKKDYFNNTYIKKLFIEKEKETLGYGNNYYYEEKNSNFTCKSEDKYYIVDFKNNIYKDVKDIFIDGFDYTSYLIYRYYAKDGNYYDTRENYSNDEKNDFTFRLSLGSVGVIKKGIEEEFFVDFGSIDKSYLKFKY